MKVPFVHSNFKRVPKDAYLTIDDRCVYGFLEHFVPDGLCVDVCAPDGSGIVDTLKKCRHNAVGLPDAFADGIVAQWVITNPPYTRDLVDTIIYRQIEKIECKEIFGLACLLRSGFSYAKSRTRMFRDNPFYWGKIELLFRPWWSKIRKAQPIHNYVWQVWMTSGALSHRPEIRFSEG